MDAEARREHHGTGRAGFPGSTDRSARFLRRIDAYLPSLPDARARRLFLDRQIAGWEHRYARFISTEGGFEPVLDPADPPQAADFLITIVGLARRRGASRSIIGDAMISDLDRRRLDGAVLSLLVAADQRCPAIIGQAHLALSFRRQHHACADRASSEPAQARRAGSARRHSWGRGCGEGSAAGVITAALAGWARCRPSAPLKYATQQSCETKTSLRQLN